jgi:hypothetical protein
MMPHASQLKRAGQPHRPAGTLTVEWHRGHFKSARREHHAVAPREVAEHRPQDDGEREQAQVHAGEGDHHQQHVAEQQQRPKDPKPLARGAPQPLGWAQAARGQGEHQLRLPRVHHPDANLGGFHHALCSLLS